MLLRGGALPISSQSLLPCQQCSRTTLPATAPKLSFPLTFWARRSIAAFKRNRFCQLLAWPFPFGNRTFEILKPDVSFDPSSYESCELVSVPSGDCSEKAAFPHLYYPRRYPCFYHCYCSLSYVPGAARGRHSAVVNSSLFCPARPHFFPFSFSLLVTFYLSVSAKVSFFWRIRFRSSCWRFHQDSSVHVRSRRVGLRR